MDGLDEMKQQSESIVTDGPLKGLVVLDLGTMIAGPFCGTLLADFGADVIKVEHPEHGDPIRAWTPMAEGQSLWWKVIGRNKRLITLDLSKSRGAELLLELARRADVVIENFRPGTIEKWGIGFTDLQRVNPGIVLVRISGYGQTGPYSGRPGYGTCAEAMSGIPAFTGFADRPPQLSAFPLADCIAGTFGTFSAMMAIYSRDHAGGVGQEIDISLFEPLFRLIDAQVVGYDKLGLIKKRLGNRLEEDSPRNAYETSDGKYVTLSASSPRTWERLARAIGRPDLVRNPKFINNAARCANSDELEQIIAQWHRERTLADVLAIFEESDVVAGPIYDIAAIFEDAHYRVREAIIDVPDQDFGRLRMQNVVPKFSRTPGRIRHTGLAKGENNEEVYLGMFGMTADEYSSLRQAGVV